MNLKDLSYCVIDTETTGGLAGHNSVIDVAVFRFHQGRIVEKFQSLINPGRPIPSWITLLTGIDDDMVRRAPRFEEIAEPLFSILEKGVFTAHNAPFDYGFIREEFFRVGRAFERPQFCTLKVARHLYSDLPSRSLGVLCENLLIDIADRHRAHGDAEATVYLLKEILRVLEKDHSVATWEDLQGFLKTGVLHLPKALSTRHVITLPEVPGTFLFRDEQGGVVFKGKATNIRQRVRNLFRRSNVSPRSEKFRQLVHSIEVMLAADKVEFRAEYSS